MQKVQGISSTVPTEMNTNLLNRCTITEWVNAIACINCYLINLWRSIFLPMCVLATRMLFVLGWPISPTESNAMSMTSLHRTWLMLLVDCSRNVLK
jgi:hypothetical protein